MPESAGHTLHFVQKAIESLKPLPMQRNPAIAFIVGVMFGALGIGIYLKSFKDFLICLGLYVFIAVVMIPAGGTGELLGIPIDILFGGFYGLLRTMTSNKTLDSYRL